MDTGELLVLFCYRVLQHCHQHDNLCTMQARAGALRAEEVSPSLPPTPVISFLRPFTCTCLDTAPHLYSTYIHRCLPYTMYPSCSSCLLNHMHTFLRIHMLTHISVYSHVHTYTHMHTHTHMYVHMHTYVHAQYSIVPTCVFSLKRAPSRWPLNWMRQW